MSCRTTRLRKEKVAEGASALWGILNVWNMQMRRSGESMVSAVENLALLGRLAGDEGMDPFDHALVFQRPVLRNAV